MEDKDLRIQTGFGQSYIEECEARRQSVENAMAIMLSATNGPNELFMEVLDSYIIGQITLEEMEERIEQCEYLNTKGFPCAGGCR